MDNWLKNNNTIKILSIVIAIMLWMVVNLDNTTPSTNLVDKSQNTYFYEANVIPIFDDSQYVVEMSTTRINVILRGQSDLIKKISNGENIDKGQFQVDLSKFISGTYEVPVEYIGFSDELNVEIQPNKITVVLESKNRKEMDIIVDKLGKEADGYQAGDPIIRPKKAHISGTSEMVEKVAFVKAFINIDNVKAPILQQAQLRAIDKNGNEVNVEITPQTVEVQIPVTSPYRTIPISYSISNYPPQGYAIKELIQLTKEVTIYGPKELVESYSFYTGPALDLSLITSSQIFKANISIDNDLLKVEPEYIEFELKIVESEIITIDNIQIEINGLSDGFKAEINQPANGISVTLEGAKSVLEEINIDDLQAFVDLANLPPGVYEIPINLYVPVLTKAVEFKVIATVTIFEE